MRSRLILLFLLPVLLYTNVLKAQMMGALPDNELVLPVEDQQINLQWYGDSVQPRMALLIPVHLPHCAGQLYMQFDLGAPNSLLYKNEILALQRENALALNIRDSTNTLFDFHFTAGKTEILARKISLREMKTDAADKNKPRIIGTLGADLIENKVVAIDYPKQKLLLFHDLPASLNAQLTLSNFIFAGRRVLLPAMLQGKSTLLYFDTGSSAFALLADKPTCISLAGTDTTNETSAVQSWDKILTAHTYNTTASITLAAKNLPIHKATYIEGASESQVKAMQQMGIGGMTGNMLFLNSVLVLDTRSQKFGLVTP